MRGKRKVRRRGGRGGKREGARERPGRKKAEVKLMVTREFLSKANIKRIKRGRMREQTQELRGKTERWITPRPGQGVDEWTAMCD